MPGRQVGAQRVADARVGAGLRAARIDARPGLAIGVGGRPWFRYVLYGPGVSRCWLERDGVRVAAGLRRAVAHAWRRWRAASRWRGGCR